MSSRAAVFVAAAIACATACDSSATNPNGETPVLTSIVVSLTPATIQVGQNALATAAGRDQYSASMATGNVIWSTGSSSFATVTTGGVVTGVGAGQTSVTATSGTVSGNATLTVSAVDLLAACRLPARFSGVGLGFPRVAARMPALGDVRVAVVFVDFSDAVATRTPQNAFAIISPVAENYFTAVSYNRMNLIFVPSYTWRRMSKPSTDYGWSGLTFAAHRLYIQEALDLAAGSLNFASVDAFLIVSNPDAGALSNGPAFTANAGQGVTAGGKSFTSGATSGRDLLGWGGYWLNHEMGHAMGLADLYAYSGTGAHRFVGGFSLMGLISGPAREFLAWERWLLGWITDDQVVCAQPGVSNTMLTPVERVGGTKMVVIPTGTTTALVAESRRVEGYDQTGFNPGVLVYYIDTAISSGNGVVAVLPINNNDNNKGTAPLGVGQSITFGGVTVTLMSQNASGDMVRVSR